MKDTKIICGSCGHLHEVNNFANDEVYFPNRMVYLEGATSPYRCPNCNWWADMIVFGENYIGGIPDITLLSDLNVKINNQLWRTKQAEKTVDNLKDINIVVNLKNNYRIQLIKEDLYSISSPNADKKWEFDKFETDRTGAIRFLIEQNI
jgi:hypothetical protein